jgi:outer membrane immunogenic protein
MRKLGISLLAFAVLMGGAANAADAPEFMEEIPIVDDVYDWSGPYIGVHGGWGVGIVDQRFGAIGGDPSTFPFDDPIPIEGWLAGVHLGANVQQDSMVFGAEALLDWAPLAGDDGDPQGFGPDNNTFEGRFLGTGAVRIGFAADMVFFYLSGGGAVLTANATITDPGEEESIGYTFVGGTVGSGVEIALSEGVSVRFDYRYYHFLPSVETWPINNRDRELTPRFHTLTAGVSVGF